MPDGVRRILIVDDPQTAGRLKALLGRHGYDVALAHTDEDGLQMASTFKPHVLLCAVKLPSIDGSRLAAALRCASQSVPTVLVALTRRSRPHDGILALDAGFDYSVTIPFEDEAVLALVASAARRMS